MSVLEAAAVQADLSALDLRFAGFLRRLAAQAQANVVEMTAALVSRERRKGHPCVALADWAQRPLAEGIDTALHFPDSAAWTKALRASAVVGSGAPATPLVLDGSGRCYLHRYWCAEQRVAHRIRALARTPAPIDTAAAAPLFRELFPPPASPDEDADRLAWMAAAVLRNRFTVVSGGPGTGKTTTIARVLALLLSVDEKTRIALAAPTGKAAARLTESIRTQSREVPVSASVRDRIACTEARTLHRLLRYAPHTGGFHHDATRPLACDVLVIDEASMVDLLLMDAVLSALPEHGRVVLVGDKDQLASVEAGFVFGDCCEVAARSAPSRSFGDQFRELSGRNLSKAAAADGGAPLADNGVELLLTWRFRDRPGIGSVADAVRRSAADDALRALADDTLADVERFDLPKDPSELVRSFVETFADVPAAATPAEALSRLNRLRILCTTNRGLWGVQGLNAAIEHMAGRRSEGEWYRGRPVLVTANDYTVGLFNGDVGVCFPDDESRMRVWFSAPAGVRCLPPAKLPPHETAWAMTVHKSQGSEFDSVVFVLPDKDSPLSNRELIYTAVTRAKERVTVFASVVSLSTAIEREACRASGLRDLLLVEGF